jgi:hypothetical protein
MDWWNSIVQWVSSDEGQRLLTGAILPFVAIVVAGLVAALIGRAAVRRVVTHLEREQKAAAVAGMIRAARKAAVYSSLGAEERTYADHLAQESEVRLRLLPAAGAGSAATWAEHEIADIKRNSVSFSFQAEQSLAQFRDRLLEWQARPSKAKKLFKYDLDRWSQEEAESARRAEDGAAPTPAPAYEQPLRPAAAASRPVSPSVAPLVAAARPSDRPSGDDQRYAAPERDDDVDEARHDSPISAATVRRRTTHDPDAR